MICKWNKWFRTLTRSTNSSKLELLPDTHHYSRGTKSDQSLGLTAFRLTCRSAKEWIALTKLRRQTCSISAKPRIQSLSGSLRLLSARFAETTVQFKHSFPLTNSPFSMKTETWSALRRTSFLAKKIRLRTSTLHSKPNTGLTLTLKILFPGSASSANLDDVSDVFLTDYSLSLVARRKPWTRV